MARLFALLTGVKDYHPQSKVPSLTGCVNDVNNVEKYLQNRFSAEDLHIKKLLNEQTKRKTFIETFCSHLINNTAIEPGDMVLFYYSGHGSHAISNKVFSEWDTESRDETLVLYDSRCEGGFDLADKELRLLLSRIPSHANIIVIADACHSGSITRNVDDLDVILLGKAKHTPARDNDKGRDLKDYLTVNNEGYEQLLDEKGKAKLPELTCISLSACDRTEVAYESSFSPQGMFTSMMLEALNAGAVNLSYANLYEHLYTLLKRRARQQTPQLEVSGGADINTVVFDKTIVGGKSIYQVVKDAENKVTVNCGALHGIRNDPESVKSIAVSYYDKDNPNDAPKLAKIKAVGLDKSELEVDRLLPKVYEATVLNLPPAICIYVAGSPTQEQQWRQLSEEIKKTALAFVYKENEYHDYLIQFSKGGIVLSQKTNGKIIVQTDTEDEGTIRGMIASCNRVSAWHQLLAMHNYAIKEEDFNKKFETSFVIELLNSAGDWELQHGDIVVYIDEQNKQVPARLRLSSTSAAGWYCGVFYMNSRFGIRKLTNPSSESKVSKGHPLSPFPDGAGLTMRDGVDEVTDYVKLILSKEPFKDFLIEEFEGFNGNRDLGAMKDFFEPERIDQDWYVKTISIKIVRRSGKIDAGKSFSSGKLTIHQHKNISGTARISALTSHAKSIHPSGQLQQFIQENGFELVSLENTKSVNPASVVWVDSIEGSVSKENPLKLILQEKPDQNGGLVALTMEDGLIQIIGIGVPDTKTGNYTVEIPALPEDGQRKKNLVRAAWFCFAKVVLQKDLSMLRKIEYKNGKVEYNDDIADCIQPGMKVAVCIHGIIGNTKGMAIAMEFLKTQNKYDLILAFDYENLNSNIEKIAETFQKLLRKAGVSKDTPVDIISHSMGGLVSRYLVERLDDTEGWVKQLFMFGTPNAGSVLGEVPKIRDWTITILTVACNYGGAYLGAMGPILVAINKVLAITKPATNTLGQMAIDSKFYKMLNGKPIRPITTQYHIIAGNVLKFEPDTDSRFQKIMEKVKRQVGELLYSSTTENDIAVGVESILTLPDGITVTREKISGHHMNYFELDASMNYFKTLVQ